MALLPIGRPSALLIASNPLWQHSRRHFGRSSTIEIYCKGCHAHLYTYQKRGKGALVKCLEDRIKKDYTNQDLLCPRCGTEFARLVRIKGRRAHKIIGGKVYHSS